jgi:hypothetical protein
MSNYTMQCKRCHVHTDYSSKTDLCDACEIKLLRSRLTIAEEMLKAIGGHPACDYSTDPEYYSDDRYQRYMGIKQGHKACATIAREGLKRMEGIR